MLEEEIHIAERVVLEGLPEKVLTLDEVDLMMPDAQMRIKGATFYACDNHTTPHEFMDKMKSFLEKKE